MAVEMINDDVFEQSLADYENVVVKYYADWCGSCRLFAPKFKRLSGDDRFSDVHFLDVNAEKNPIARRKAGVTNLPFFAIFKKGELVDAAATNREEVVVELIEKLH